MPRCAARLRLGPAGRHWTGPPGCADEAIKVRRAGLGEAAWDLGVRLQCEQADGARTPGLRELDDPSGAPLVPGLEELVDVLVKPG